MLRPDSRDCRFSEIVSTDCLFWEQERRERLARYASEREELAGIVVYDGEWNDTSGSPSESDARRQDLDESQETSFPDDFDQRPPPQWEESQWDQRPIADATVQQTLAGPDIDQSPSDDREERQWDQTPRYWSDTPLGQWAIEANRWDGVSQIDQELVPNTIRPSCPRNLETLPALCFFQNTAQPARFKIPAGQHRSGQPHAFCSE